MPPDLVHPAELMRFLKGPESDAKVPLCRGEIGNSTVLMDGGTCGAAKVGDDVVFENGESGVILTGRSDLLICGKPAAVPESSAAGPKAAGYVSEDNAAKETTTFGQVAKDVAEKAADEAGGESGKQAWEERRAERVNAARTQRSKDRIASMSPDEVQSRYYGQKSEFSGRKYSDPNPLGGRYRGAGGGKLLFGELVGVYSLFDAAAETNEAIDEGKYGKAAYKFGKTMAAAAAMVAAPVRALKVVRIVAKVDNVTDYVELGMDAAELLESGQTGDASSAGPPPRPTPGVVPKPTPQAPVGGPAVGGSGSMPAPTPTPTPAPVPKPAPGGA